MPTPIHSEGRLLTGDGVARAAINWGNTVNTDTKTGKASAQAPTVFGQISAGQLVVPSSYTDTITATAIY